MLKKNKNRVYIYGGDKLKYTKLIKEKEYLIKTAINDLNIFNNYDELYRAGKKALYEIIIKYERNIYFEYFDIYAYYTILNHLRNELIKINKYKIIDNYIDLCQNDYLEPIIVEDFLRRVELEDLVSKLSRTQQCIINLKRQGYKNEDIVKKLNISMKQVKYQLNKGFKNLKNLINKKNIH